MIENTLFKYCIDGLSKNVFVHEINLKDKDTNTHLFFVLQSFLLHEGHYSQICVVDGSVYVLVNEEINYKLYNNSNFKYADTFTIEKITNQKQKKIIETFKCENIIRLGNEWYSWESRQEIINFLIQNHIDFSTDICSRSSSRRIWVKSKDDLMLFKLMCSHIIGAEIE